MTGVSVRQIWRLVDRREFPAPKKVGSRTYWVAAEVLLWIKRPSKVTDER